PIGSRTRRTTCSGVSSLSPCTCRLEPKCQVYSAARGIGQGCLQVGAVALPLNLSPNQLTTAGPIVEDNWMCPTLASHNDVKSEPAAQARWMYRAVVSGSTTLSSRLSATSNGCEGDSSGADCASATAFHRGLLTGLPLKNCCLTALRMTPSAAAEV